MHHLEDTIAWVVAEETDLCEGDEAVSAAVVTALGIFDACGAPQGDGSQRRCGHLTRYWAEQMKRESCT